MYAAKTLAPKDNVLWGEAFLGVEREPVGQRVIFVDEERAAAGLIGRAGDLDAHGGEAPDLFGGDGLPREALPHEVILRRLLTDGEPAAVDEVVRQTLADEDRDGDGKIGKEEFAASMDSYAWDSFTVPVRAAARREYFLDAPGQNGPPDPL